MSSPRRKSRSNASSEPEEIVEDNITLSNYKKCYIEDFMTRTVGKLLIVLLPDRYQSGPFSPWYEMMASNTKSKETTFSNKRYIGYVSIVTTNPILSQVQHSLYYSDYVASFGNHNYGCNLLFHNDDNKSSATYNS